MVSQIEGAHLVHLVSYSFAFHVGVPHFLPSASGNKILALLMQQGTKNNGKPLASL